MKKFSILILTVLFIIGLVGCDPGTCYFFKDSYLDKVERIELVRYKNEDFEMVDASETVLKFDHAKVEKIDTLDAQKVEDFLNDFEKIVFHLEQESVNEPTGYCLLWYLKNGNFIVFSCTLIKGDRGYCMAAEFDANDRFVKHYAYFAARPHYDNVLSKYFPDYRI